MSVVKFKHSKAYLQGFFLRLAMVLSVFVLTGYNESFLTAQREATKTELVSSRTFRTVNCYDLATQHHRQAVNVQTRFFIKTSIEWIVSNFNTLVAVQYRSALKKMFSYRICAITLPLKRIFPPSSDEETPSFS